MCMMNPVMMNIFDAVNPIAVAMQREALNQMNEMKLMCHAERKVRKKKVASMDVGV